MEQKQLHKRLCSEVCEVILGFCVDVDAKKLLMPQM